MSISAQALFAFLVALSVVSAVPSPSSVGSSIQILLHNDLYGDESPRKDAVLVLEASKTREDAAKACWALGEALWSPSLGLSNDANFLKYLSYTGDKAYVNGHGLYHVEGQEPRGSCKAVTTDMRTIDVQCNTRLPALCTQSAALATVNETDTSARFQTAVAAGEAQYTGYRDKLSFQFLGIKYGDYEERFSYSSEYPNTGNVTAFDFGAHCPQIASGTHGLDGNEDCLYLNIWSPYLPGGSDSGSSQLRPVIPNFDGGNLASRGDVVVATINYRLGDLGFLALGNGTGLKGNYGISDQVSALEWVRSNIASFGGDPDRVTIFGQSAGAASVRALLQSPPAKDLFSAAIMESDPTPPAWALYPSIEEEVVLQTEAILNFTDCANPNPNLEADCLRKYDLAGLVIASTVADKIVVDGKYILAPEIFSNGTIALNRVPLLMGTMRDDGAAGNEYVETSNLSLSLQNNSLPVAPVVDNPSIFPLAPSANVSLDVFNVTAEVCQDEQFRCLDLATAYAAAKLNTFPEVYYFEFNRSYKITTWPSQPLKALCNAPPKPGFPNENPDAEYFKCHSGDLQYVFASWRRSGLPARDGNDTPFTQFVVDSWTAWARDHNPNPASDYLQARGYVNTSREIQSAGTWQPVTAESQSLRQLQWPSEQRPFEHGRQCTAVGQPIDYFL